MACRNVVDLITVVGMGMHRDRSLETLVYDVPDIDRFILHHKFNVLVLVCDFSARLHGGSDIVLSHANIIPQNLRERDIPFLFLSLKSLMDPRHFSYNPKYRDYIFSSERRRSSGKNERRDPARQFNRGIKGI